MQGQVAPLEFAEQSPIISWHELAGSAPEPEADDEIVSTEGSDPDALPGSGSTDDVLAEPTQSPGFIAWREEREAIHRTNAWEPILRLRSN
jgi:hypothetical protein